MMPRALFVTVFGAALACGLVAGVFFAFSTFVMRGLGTLPAPEGVRAMQAINVAAPSGLFLATLLGTACACGFLAIEAALARTQPGAGLRLGGSLAYLGSFLVTIAANVPRNDALAALDAHSPDAAAAWVRYVWEWTAWNHARTVGAFAAALLLILSLLSTESR